MEVHPDSVEARRYGIVEQLELATGPWSSSAWSFCSLCVTEEEEGKDVTEEEAGEGSGGGMRTVTTLSLGRGFFFLSLPLGGVDDRGEIWRWRVCAKSRTVARAKRRKTSGGMALGIARTKGAVRPRTVAE